MERYRVVVRDDFGVVRDETLDVLEEAEDRLVEMLMEYGETHLVDLKFVREGEE